jgi:heme-degrading monooxygenase HmoA
MAIGVIIKRVGRPGVDAKVLLSHIVELRAHAVRQPGYISGETFFGLNRPEECLVIGRWISLEYWEQWEKNLHRIELNEKIEKLCLCKTEYSIYSIGLW